MNPACAVVANPTIATIAKTIINFFIAELLLIGWTVDGRRWTQDTSPVWPAISLAQSVFFIANNRPLEQILRFIMASLRKNKKRNFFQLIR